MNKSQLINAVAESVNLSKVDVKRVVDELFLQMEKNHLLVQLQQVRLLKDQLFFMV
jgi:nucleoid DNA-binding protein